jgi:hypothetical protein
MIKNADIHKIQIVANVKRHESHKFSTNGIFCEVKKLFYVIQYASDYQIYILISNFLCQEPAEKSVRYCPMVCAKNVISVQKADKRTFLISQKRRRFWCQ